MTRLAAADGAIPFSSLAELRTAHLNLLRAWRAKEEKADAAAIIAFRGSVAATGEVLGSETEREAAQDMLEYWGAQLLSARGSEPVPNIDAQIAPHRPPEVMVPAGNETKGLKGSDAHEQIRLGALARQWRQSNGVQSYLLAGAALARAAAFRKTDPDIEAFVAASERRVAERKIRHYRRIGAGAVLVLVLSATGGYLYLSKIRDAEEARESQSKAETASSIYLRSLQRATDNLISAETGLSGDTLLRLTFLIDNADTAQGRRIVTTLTDGLKPGALQPVEQIRAADSLVGNLMHPSVDGLSAAGLDNLLQVLSSIRQSQWALVPPNQLNGQGWIGSRAGARRAAANLRAGAGSLVLSDEAKRLFNILRENVRLDPPPVQSVLLRFADVAKDSVADIGAGMGALGWKLQAPVPAAARVPSNEVVYGAPADKDAADMLAADLGKCGLALEGARSDPAIPAGTLEILLAEPPTMTCVPPAGAAGATSPPP